MGNNMINSFLNETSYMAVLWVKPMNNTYRRRDTAVDVGVKLSTMLKKEQFVCLQIKGSEDGKSQACIFSSKDAKVQAEDFGWMFGDCADIGPFCEVSSVIRHDATDEIYALCPTSDDSGEQHERCKNKTSNRSDSVSRDYFRQLFNEIKKTDVAVQFIAGVSRKGKIGVSKSERKTAIHRRGILPCGRSGRVIRGRGN